MGGRVGGVQDGCERRIGSFCENSKKKINIIFFFGGGGCRVGGWGVRVDVNREVKFL